MRQLIDLMNNVNRTRPNERMKRTRGIVITNRCIRTPLCFYCNYPMGDAITTTVSEAVETAGRLIEQEVDRITLVSGWMGYENDTCVPYVKAIKRAYPDIRLSAALGPISRARMEDLYEAGLDQYGCNVESVPRLLPGIKGTDDFEERIYTLLAAKDTGLVISSGFIIGVGETAHDLSYLYERLQELDLDSIFLSPFVPYKGTLMEGWPRPSLYTVLSEVATTRLSFPKKDIGFRIYRNGGFFPLLVIALVAYAGATFFAPPIPELPQRYEDMKRILDAYPTVRENLEGIGSMITPAEREEMQAIVEHLHIDNNR